METRISNPISLGPNIRTSQFDDAQAARATKQLGMGELLPSDTSVSEEIKSVFDNSRSFDGELMGLLSQACSNPELRKSGNFNRALSRARKLLKNNGKSSGGKAAAILSDLENDQELLANYRATLL